MGILGRFVAVVRSNLNALLNRAEDPTKMLEQTLLDMDSAYRKAKEQVAHSVANQKRLEKSVQDQKNDTAKWGERAMQAVEGDNDDLAREALRRKQEHSRTAAQYEHELAAQVNYVEQLKDGLRDLETKIAEIRRKKDLLISQQKRAEAQSQIYQTLEGINSAGALETIERMESKIEEMTHLADARMEMSDEFQGDELERKFDKLDNAGGDVEDELLQMKKKLRLEDKSGS